MITALILTIGVGLNSCTDDFEEINTDPLSLTADKVDASLIGLAFAQTQYNTLNGLHWRFQISQNLFSDLYAQYFATTQSNFDSDRYLQVGRWSDLCWTSFYGEAAPNIKFVEDFTAGGEGNEENADPVGNAVAKIWRVYGYHRITDYYGPVPYFDFGNAALEVPYDSQEDIYRNFFTTLDEAVAVLKSNPGGTAFGKNDQIYGGDPTKWVLFANTLRLRLALRVKAVDPQLAKSEAEKAVQGGVMETGGDSAFLLTTALSQNPINTITNWGEYRMSSTSESILKGYDDPRTPIYFSPAANGDRDDDPDDFPYEGLRNGQSKIDITADQNSPHSDLGPNFLPANLGGNPPVVVIRAAEAWLLRAEGALMGWNMGTTAEDAYNNGITESLTEWGVGADAAAYINSPAVPASPEDGLAPVTDIPVKYDATDATRAMEQVITQKWLALYPDGWEAWAVLRITGFPATYDRLNSENPNVAANETMRKMKYVTSEFDNNRAAVEAAIGFPENGGQDHGNVRVWWNPN